MEDSGLYHPHIPMHMANAFPGYCRYSQRRDVNRVGQTKIIQAFEAVLGKPMWTAQQKTHHAAKVLARPRRKLPLLRIRPLRGLLVLV